MRIRLRTAVGLLLILLVWVFWGSWKSFRALTGEGELLRYLDFLGCGGVIVRIFLIVCWVMSPVFICILIFVRGDHDRSAASLREALYATGLVTFYGLAFGVLWFPIIAAFRIPPPTVPDSGYVAPSAGDLSAQGGSATVREGYDRPQDDPGTTNDESNDQPIGHFGTMTLHVVNGGNGHEYTLDGDVNELELERIYFPKGGWVDFPDCELDENFFGECIDEKGRSWSIEGEV